MLITSLEQLKTWSVTEIILGIKMTQFPTPETIGNLGTNLTRKVFWDRLGGHARHLKSFPRKTLKKNGKAC